MRSMNRSELSAWWLLCGVALLALVLGSWGSHLYLLAQGKPAPFSDCIYRAVQLFGFNLYDPGPLPWQLELARWLAPLVALASLLAAFSGALRGLYLSLQLGRLRRHTVLVGPRWSSALQVPGAAPAVFVCIGGNTQPRATTGGNLRLEALSIEEAVSRCAMHRSAMVLVEVAALDEGVRWMAALKMACQMSGRSAQDVCLVSHALDTAAGLQALSTLAEPQLRVRVLDPTQLLFERLAGWLAAALAQRTAGSVRLWLAGDPDYSLEIARQLAKRIILLPGLALHLEICTPPGSPLADSALQALIQAAPHIGFSQSALELDDGLVCLTSPESMLCYCGKHANALLRDHGALRRILQADDAPHVAIAIHSAWPASEAVAALLGQATNARLTLVCGATDQELLCTVQADSALERLARQVHSSYLKTAHDHETPASRPWETLPEPYRESSRLQVNSFVFKLASLGYSLETAVAQTAALQVSVEVHIEALAEAEHRRWSAEKQLQGWTYASRRDDIAKTHPSLIAYAELPETEKEKDRLMWRELIAFVMAAKQVTLPPTTLKRS